MHQKTATNFIKATATLFMAAMAGPMMLSAAALNGVLSLNSHGTETIAVNGTDIDFDFSGTATGSPPVTTAGVDGTGDSGMFDIAAGSTGSFGATSPVVGTTVTVHDLNSTAEPAGPPLAVPLTNFITFAVEPGWNITLTQLNLGTDPTACNGSSQFCSPAGSPFNIQNEFPATQTTGNVLVGFTFAGTETDGLGDTSSVSGSFSTEFVNTSYEAILADLSSGESIVSSASAQIGVTPIPVTTTPEPASVYMLLLGSALLMGSAAYRRHQRR
jgi:hypothetical protein